MKENQADIKIILIYDEPETTASKNNINNTKKKSPN